MVEIGELSPMARSSNQQSLNEVINELINAYRLREGLNEVRVNEQWEKLMGKVIASKTISLSLHKSVLTVRLNSSVLRQELLYKREEIVQAMNKAREMEAIKEIQLL